MTKKYVVLFSEAVSKTAESTARALAQSANHVVYVLHRDGEKQIADSFVRTLEIKERRQEMLKEAMQCIGREQGKIDMLVLSAGRHCACDGKITERHDYEKLMDVLDENVIGTLEVVKSATDLLRVGGGKRIALLTERDSGINLTRRESDYGYFMSLAALNMMEKVLFNTFRPEGFTFRCYAADGIGGMSPESYLLSNLCDDPEDAYIHSDENRIVMRNRKLCELPW